MPDRYVRPNPAKSALIIIDIQNDFAVPDGPAYIPGTAEAIPAMKRVLALYRAASLPIFHIIRLYQADGSNVDLCRRASIESGASIVRPSTEGAGLVDALKLDPSMSLDAGELLAGEPQSVGPKEWILYKSRWSAFYQTKLDTLLHDLAVDTLVFMGCNFPNCPRSTIYDASNRDFRVVVVTDAMSGLYEKGLDELHSIGIRTIASDQFGEWLAV